MIGNVSASCACSRVLPPGLHVFHAAAPTFHAGRARAPRKRVYALSMTSNFFWRETGEEKGLDCSVAIALCTLDFFAGVFWDNQFVGAAAASFVQRMGRGQGRG